MPARVVVALRLVAVALLVAGCSTKPRLAIDIVSPADGASVPAGEPIPIEADITGGHMQGTDQVEVTAE